MAKSTAVTVNGETKSIKKDLGKKNKTKKHWESD